MVIAATNDTDVNIRVFEDAEQRAMLVNVVDVPPLCNFILPRSCAPGRSRSRSPPPARRPALAKRIKREIAEAYGEPYARLAELLTRRAAGRRARCPPTRTARSSSRGSSTASPTRSSSCAQGDEQAVRDLIAAAQRTARAGLMAELTHLDDDGRARMVDVGGKDVDRPPRGRRARSCACRPETAAAVRDGDAPKGDVIGRRGSPASRRRSERPS